MPITINGTGSITGISAGGLPDASVTLAELASSVASALVKAWVNFNGTGTVAIRNSLNVSSITDNGTGSYTVNFETALSSANYCVVGMTNTSSASTTNRPMGISSAGDGSAPTTKTASAVRLLTGLTSLADMENVNVLVIN